MASMRTQDGQMALLDMPPDATEDEVRRARDLTLALLDHKGWSRKNLGIFFGVHPRSVPRMLAKVPARWVDRVASIAEASR